MDLFDYSDPLQDDARGCSHKSVHLSGAVGNAAEKRNAFSISESLSEFRRSHFSKLIQPRAAR